MVTYTFIITLLGDSGIGKTCLLKRFVDSEYFDSGFCTNDNNTCPSTIGVQFHYAWILAYEKQVNKRKRVKLQGKYLRSNNVI